MAAIASAIMSISSSMDQLIAEVLGTGASYEMWCLRVSHLVGIGMLDKSSLCAGVYMHTAPVQPWRCWHLSRDNVQSAQDIINEFTGVIRSHASSNGRNFPASASTQIQQLGQSWINNIANFQDNKMMSSVLYLDHDGDVAALHLTIDISGILSPRLRLHVKKHVLGCLRLLTPSDALRLEASTDYAVQSASEKIQRELDQNFDLFCQESDCAFIAQLPTPFCSTEPSIV